MYIMMYIILIVLIPRISFESELMYIMMYIMMYIINIRQSVHYNVRWITFILPGTRCLTRGPNFTLNYYRTVPEEEIIVQNIL